MTEIWIWTAIAVGGLALAVLLGREARKDLRALRKAHIGNGRVALAETWLAQEVLRAFIHLDFGAIGIALLLGIDLGPWVRWGLIAGSAAIVGNSLLALRYRRLLRATRDAEPAVGEETRDQREDREMGDKRRLFEEEHLEEARQEAAE